MAAKLDVELISPEPSHVPELARICFEAFQTVHERHGFPSDVPTLDVARRILEMLISRKEFYGVAARVDGKLAGSNFILLADPVGAVGPITVDSAVEDRGLGRLLMRNVLDHAKNIGVHQTRLMQDSFNTKSFSLYSSLGFEVCAPVGMMNAKPAAVADPTVRPAMTTDLPKLDELSRRIYKTSRRGELTAAFKFGFPLFLRETGGRVTGYLIPGFTGHGMAETEADALTLIGQAMRHVPPEFALFFCPLTLGDFYRASLRAGHRLRKIMTLMAKGPYEKPEGVWMPSIGY